MAHANKFSRDIAVAQQLRTSATMLHALSNTLASRRTDKPGGKGYALWDGYWYTKKAAERYEQDVLIAHGGLLTIGAPTFTGAV